MIIPIMRNGELTEEAEDIFEHIAEVSRQKLNPETVRGMCEEMRRVLNQAGGINCPDERADELWSSVQRQHGVPEQYIEPRHMRRH